MMKHGPTSASRMYKHNRVTKTSQGWNVNHGWWAALPAAVRPGLLPRPADEDDAGVARHGWNPVGVAALHG